MESSNIEAVAIGYCQCGCGNRTSIATQRNIKWGHIKGQPVRFIRGHAVNGPRHPRWNNGIHIVKVSGRKVIKLSDHPRASIGRRYVFESIILAEKVLGKPIPERHPIHHFPQYPSDQLVICEDTGYHNFLHRRYRSFLASGHATWLKCVFCKNYDDPINLSVGGNRRQGVRALHPRCRKHYNQESYRRKKNVDGYIMDSSKIK